MLKAGPQRGFTLLEILVAIVVLSFGVLGMVGMQAAALQSNRAARDQSTAVALGRELADLMRANKDVALSANNNYLVDDYSGPAPEITVNCATNACTNPATLAQFDRDQWLGRVSAALPGARVVVCFDDTPYDDSGVPQWACNSEANQTLVVKIGWTQQSSAEDNRTEQAAVGRPGVVLPVTPGTST